MAEYKTLLFATDFSEGATRAVDHARSLAVLTRGKLHLLHVITELSDKRGRRVPPDVIELFNREVKANAVEDMNTFKDKYFGDAEQSGYEVTTEIVIGSGYEDILESAAQVNADMIIMGTHGRTGIEKILVGSTAERVIRHAKIPVLIIRE